jgi:hypothetical protein
VEELCHAGEQRASVEAVSGGAWITSPPPVVRWFERLAW